MATTRQDTHPARLDMNRQAIAIPIDFECPVASGRHPLGKQREARLDAIWHGGD
ncbi:hypothetical protein [Ensifer sp. 1H6]|uniref:hypothetical protein n=1 Tax=Ensifer sp. 1H6 TaxID=1911585 RepID=UPI0032AF126F